MIQLCQMFLQIHLYQWFLKCLRSQKFQRYRLNQKFH
jgi:hypothetical protein